MISTDTDHYVNTLSTIKKEKKKRKKNALLKNRFWITKIRIIPESLCKFKK